MKVRISAQVRATLQKAESRAPSDYEYVQFVRRFKRSELVALIARVAPRYAFNEFDPKAQTLITPWGLADVARVSLVFGSDNGRRTPSEQDLSRCLFLHNNLGHAGMEHEGAETWRGIFLQIAFYQLPFQQQVGALLGRSMALFQQTLADDPSRTRLLVGDWQERLMGCSLSDYIGVTQILMAAARPNGGQFDPAWLENSGPPEVLELFDPEITRMVLRDHLVAEVNSYKARDHERPSLARRFTFNPLVDRPIVRGIGSSLLMPVPDFVLWKATPTGLYFTGLKRWGEEFAHDLGFLLQSYVGRHLRLIVRWADVHPELSYGPRKLRKDSVDWIVVFPSLVLLVEVKAARPTEAVRMGSDQAASAFQRAFDKGNQQIEATAEQIVGAATEFLHIPSDRAIMGVVVTLEDFLVANSVLHRPMYASSTTVPTFAVSVSELEQLVCLGPRLEAFLHNMKAGGPHINLQSELAKSEFEERRNPLLQEGIEATPIMKLRD